LMMVNACPYPHEINLEPERIYIESGVIAI
jgi:hypothetical protein